MIHLRSLAAALAVLALTGTVSAQPARPAMARPIVNAPPPIDAPALVGPSPAADSVRAAADRLSMRSQVSAERLARANADNPWTPWVAMQPVFGAAFTEQRLPRTARVFDDVLQGLSPAIGATKNANSRPRPLISDPSLLRCDALDPAIAAQSSFPSGHGAGGWAWALVLAELVPARADAILQRGRDFGDSRVLCGYHYPSDIEAGRMLAAGVIARLHADAAFRRDLDAARAELARAYPAH
ncbi:MAG: phosphatase PAP2 family protein [Proteobacteria bacterium]|nr:phosphatase PAP2 family protein [Pseudomonadota bacterium]